MTVLPKVTSDDLSYLYGLLKSNNIQELQPSLHACVEGCRKYLIDLDDAKIPDALTDVADVLVRRTKTVQSAHDLATLFFESALKIAPTHVRTLVSYGRLHFNVQSNFAKAHQCFQQALAQDGNNVKALESMGDLLRVGGNGIQADHTLAIKYLEKALKINPKSPIALESLATLYADSVLAAKFKYDQAKQPNASVLKAKELFERLLAEQPNNVAALSHLTNYLHFGIGGVAKDENTAELYCRRILSLDPANEFANIIKLDALALSDTH